MGQSSGNSLPLVSIIVVNYNGFAHLEPCLQSLMALDYPRERLELIVVDNGSSDRSVPFLREHFPDVKLILNGLNLGFARASNIGAEQASGEFLAFLNNDTRVRPDWLRELLKPVNQAEGIVCVGSAMLRWDGKAIDFMGGFVNFCGHGMQPHFGQPYREGVADGAPRPIPFACGGAMLVDRKVFLESGGFDEEFFAYFEDVDFGWRLWLLGYKVVLAPKAIVYHRHHGTGGRIPDHQRQVLYERNALLMILKNLEHESLNAALPAALLLLMKRAVRSAGVNRHAYLFGAKARRERESVARVGLACLIAAEEVAEKLPAYMEKRHVLQSRRRRSDEEIFRLWDTPVAQPSYPGVEYADTQRKIMAALGLDRLINGSSTRRVLLICHEPIGARMAGPAIRYWELARVLSERFTVRLAHPGDETVPNVEDFEVLSYGRGGYASLLDSVQWADVVVVYGYLLYRFRQLPASGKPLVVDIYDVFFLENLHHHRRASPADQNRTAVQDLALVNYELRVGDFYVCASERQRDYWLGMLAANGRLNPTTYGEDRTFRSLIDVVPFGLPSTPPEKGSAVLKGVHPGIGADDKVVIWGGGMWDWFDPATAVRAIAKVCERRTDVKLFFMAKQHLDSATVPEMAVAKEASDLSRELGLLDRHVFFGDWVPYEQRGDYLLEADIGLSLHVDGAESHLAFRTRLLDYIWAGLPVVATGGDVLGDQIGAQGLGYTVPAGNVDEVARAILALLEEGDARANRREAFARFAATLTWERAAEPLLRFLEKPSFAPDRARSTLLVKAQPVKVDGLPTDGVPEPTPYHKLPARALQILRSGGPSSLYWEVKRYIRWWREFRD